MKEVCGYDDFMFHTWFETGGFSGREVEEQMQAFAEEVAPELRRACGGGPKREESTVSFDDVRV